MNLIKMFVVGMVCAWTVNYVFTPSPSETPTKVINGNEAGFGYAIFEPAR